jgi:Ras-related protein Rab-6A
LITSFSLYSTHDCFKQFFHCPLRLQLRFIVRIQLWDTAGQEKFRALIPVYIRDSSVAIIVYDITNKTSFLNTKQWVEDVRTERGKDVVMMLVGNKSDMSAERQVTTEEGKARADEYGIMFIETSAKQGFNVKEMFKQLAMALPGKEADNVESTNKTVKLTIEAESTTVSACAC